MRLSPKQAKSNYELVDKSNYELIADKDYVKRNSKSISFMLLKNEEDSIQNMQHINLQQKEE